MLVPERSNGKNEDMVPASSRVACGARQGRLTCGLAKGMLNQPITDLLMNPLKISAKNLGALAMPTFCPRCFWLKAHLKLPFQIFPGIFATIDSYSKKVTNVFWEFKDRLPNWFLEFGDLSRPVPTPHHTKFFVVDEQTGIRLTGVPDEIIRRTDGSYFIVDYKTAKFTGSQDQLLPMYDVQLNAYAYIGNRYGFTPVTGIGLVYYEPQTDLGEDDLPAVVGERRFLMPFAPKLLPLELRPEEQIPPLLMQVEAVLRQRRPPKGRDGCQDCERLDELLRFLG